MAWIIDLDGVMWRGDEPIDGSSRAVTALRTAGHEVVFVTNNSSVPASRVEERLAAMGVDAAGQVVTSAHAAASLLSGDERVMVRGGDGVHEAVAARGATVVPEGPADAVVVGWHRDFTYDSLAEAHQCISGGARFIATNDDATYPTADGEIPGGGAIVAYLERSTGITPVIAGKPHRTIADLLRSRLGGDGWVVGDRPDTDGLLAAHLGYRFGLVRSGVAASDGDPAPAAVADHLAALVERVLGSDQG